LLGNEQIQSALITVIANTCNSNYTARVLADTPYMVLGRSGSWLTHLIRCPTIWHSRLTFPKLSIKDFSKNNELFIEKGLFRL